jgi:hypothetical protein
MFMAGYVMIYAIRRIEDKAFFGTIQTSKDNLFDAIDEHADPFGFEYSTMRFEYTGNNGVDVWLRFDATKKLNIQVNA